MNAIQDLRCNDVLGAPTGATIEECRALPIRRGVYSDGTPVIQSFWRPTETELALLIRGEPLMLTILGHTHAPVLVEVT